MGHMPVFYPATTNLSPTIIVGGGLPGRAFPSGRQVDFSVTVSQISIFSITAGEQ